LFPCGTPFGTQVGASAMKGDAALGRKLLKEAGYAGQKVVIINPTDFPSIGPFGEVTYDLLKNKLGMNADLQDMDWGTVVQRRASKNPIDQGGWSIFHTWWPSDSILNPVLSAIIRGQGASGWFGWFSDAKIEQLTNDFLSATDPAARMKITDAIQEQAFVQAPTIPLGLFYIRNGYQANLSHMLVSQAPFFWSVRRT
jgi:peptide/nickel transport system substrate-binding protein